MSLHKSLTTRGRLKRDRNVLTRWERIERLKEEERWDEGRSVFALPKVKVARHKRHKKAKKEVAAVEGEAAEGAVAPEAAQAPSSDAKKK
ncbi:MAG TPA: small basic protein [Planctomycetota bacterium]|nr:small basic protein [Planctomycetota bacterium]